MTLARQATTDERKRIGIRDERLEEAGAARVKKDKPEGGLPLDLATMSIAALKELAKQPAAVNDEFLTALAQDRRKGAQNLLSTLNKEREAESREMRRLERLFIYEENVWANGYYPVAGVDEAGRGPLAGPVLAAAVILPRNCVLSGLNDSKKLTPQKRAQLAGRIKETALSWSVAQATVGEISHCNIFQATLLAMRRAVEQLETQPAYVLVDGFRIDQLPIPQIPVVGGDRLSASIAAASILAKVERDAIMDDYHEMYPAYGFIRHKGYGTAEHLAALNRFGPCPIHRLDFTPVRLAFYNRHNNYSE